MFCVRRGCGAGAQSTSSAFYIQSSSAFCSNDLETMPKILKPKKENNDLATMPTIRKKKKKKKKHGNDVQQSGLYTQHMLINKAF